MDRRYLPLLIKVLKGYYRERRGTAEYWREPFRVLVSCILSQRTQDENSIAASGRLFARAGTPEKILAIPAKELQSLVKQSGTYRQKALHIRQACRMLIRDFHGNVPKTRGSLMRLPGIGPKCADIILMNAFGVPAIAVDTHVNVVSKRLGFVGKKASVEEVKKSLEGYFPKSKWRYINLGMVNFGRDVCVTRAPLCIESRDNCPFSGFCRAYGAGDFAVQ
jgi:endonuclease-3